MIIPIRCFTCGKVCGNKWEAYLSLLQVIIMTNRYDLLFMTHFRQNTQKVMLLMLLDWNGKSSLDLDWVYRVCLKVLLPSNVADSRRFNREIIGFCSTWKSLDYKLPNKQQIFSLQI